MNIRYQLFNEYDSHQIIHPFIDSGGRTVGFVAIHNLNLGPALGGTRIFSYTSEREALKDALRLSRAMTYKCAIAGLPFGGGKGVIIAPPGSKPSLPLLRHYANHINSLNGQFHTGEDVGLSEHHVHYMLKFSNYFIGKPKQAGDPSPFAGESAYQCGKIAIKAVFGSDEVRNKKILIKGIGKTGSTLAKYYIKHGASIWVSDIDAKRIKLFLKTYPQVKAIDGKDIWKERWDVYAPCALGHDIHEKNVGKIRADIIAGTANNQLESPEIAEQLYKNGILHVPDYISNAGGLINVADELLPGGYSSHRVHSNIQKLTGVLETVFNKSLREHRNPDIIADEKAQSIFQQKQMVAAGGI